MSDCKMIEMKVSEGYMLPFDMDYMTTADVEFIIKAGLDAWNFVSDQVSKMDEMRKMQTVILAKNAHLEAELNKYKAAVDILDTSVSSKTYIEIQRHDKEIRAFMNKQNLHTSRKTEDNIQRIKSWASENDLEIKFISPK
jgi:hypothetical protein